MVPSSKRPDGKSVAVPDQASLTQYVTEFLTPPANEPGAARDSAVRLALAATATTQLPPLTSTTIANTPILDDSKWQAAQKTVPFPLQAPTYLPDEFRYTGKSPDGDGTYDIRVEGGLKPAVRMLYRYQGSLYLGISVNHLAGGTIGCRRFGRAEQRRHLHGGGQLDKPGHVWWEKDGVLYWVSNTLTYTVDGGRPIQDRGIDAAGGRRAQ